MGIVHVLDKHTANLIAAGEVVERPSSAIKELLENSADAGATAVTVEIKNGGSTYIRVSDNGCGISPEDVPVCILRHATSKIREPRDLEAIPTLGFRGEALAAVAAVTRLRLLTKRREDETGTFFQADFGEKKTLSETGCPDGTTIIAENLFENVPARRKFLRRDVSEAKSVLAAAEKFALSKPGIALTVISDGAIKLKTPGDGELRSAIYATLGRDFADHMLPVDYTYGGVAVSGFIGKPEIARPNRNLQNFFINERYIKSGTMVAGLEEGFKSFCPIGKFPACVLFVTMDLRLVDVNIHPAKLEVKFSDERPVFEAVMYAARNSLSRGMSSFAPQAFAPTRPPQAVRTPGQIVPDTDGVFGNGAISSLGRREEERITDSGIVSLPGSAAPQIPTAQETAAKPTGTVPPVEKTETPPTETDAEKEMSPETDAKTAPDARAETVSPRYTASELSLFEHMPPAPEKAPDKPFQNAVDEETSEALLHRIRQGVTVIGEAFDSYILVERDNTLYLIDKHAAHERILYESLKKGKREGGTQLLLMPPTVKLSSEEAVAVTEHGDYLESVGFVFEEFGTNTYLLRGVPSELDAASAEETFVYLAGQIARAGGRAIGDLFDRALYTAACKAAVKAGTKTSKLSSAMIADIVFSEEAVLYCPHGRPVIVEFPKSKLDRMFSRT